MRRLVTGAMGLIGRQLLGSIGDASVLSRRPSEARRSLGPVEIHSGSRKRVLHWGPVQKQRFLNLTFLKLYQNYLPSPAASGYGSRPGGIEEGAMDVTLHIPDELAQRLKAAGGDISRRALEVLALDEYKIGHLTADELRRVLGFDAEADLDAFLTAHSVQPGDAHEAQTDKAERLRAAQEAAQAIRQMSRGVRLGGLKIKDLINEGRR